MVRINLNQYIYTPAAIFDLQGCCYYSDRKSGIPCRIKVGPRRWLEEVVCPEKLAVTLWQERDGVITYLPSEPVQPTPDRDGVLMLDMVAFAYAYFGKEQVSFCDSQSWKWYKYDARSDVFLATPYGIASSYSVWLDIDITHSTLRFRPGTLKLCGHDVRSIYWSTFCDEVGASGALMHPLIEATLSGSHTVSAEAFMGYVSSSKLLLQEGFNRLMICTDQGRFDLSVGLGKALNIFGEDGIQILAGYEPAPENSIEDHLSLLLQLMQAATADEICATAENLLRQGLVVQKNG